MAAFLIRAYGIPEFFADLDKGRDYGAEGESIVHSSLAWASEAGFGELARELDLKDANDQVFSDALAWRQRHMITELVKMRSIWTRRG